MKNEITRRKFKEFIYNGVLTRPKTKIAKSFGMSVDTLYRWMRKNGFEDLIGTMKDGKAIRNIKDITDDYGNTSRYIQEKPRSMGYVLYTEKEEED